MSLVGDALQQKAQDTRWQNESDDGPGFSAEPQFNPLAGARHEPERRPLRRCLILLCYVALIGVLMWQIWLGWRTLYSTENLAESAVSATPVPTQEVATETPIERAVTTSSTDDRVIPEPASTPIALPELTPPQPRPASAQAMDTATADDSERLPAPEPLAAPTASVVEVKAVPSASATQPAEEASPAQTASREQAKTAPRAAERRPETAVVTSPSRASASTSDRAASSATTSAAVATPPVTRSVNFTHTDRTRTLTSIRDQYQAGDTEAALDRAAAYLRQDDHTDARQLYARLLLRQGDAESARHIVKPGHNVAELELRAYADYQVGAFTDAVRHYSELIRRGDRIQQEWYLWLAVCYDNLENFGQATTFYQRYLQQTSGQPNSLVRYARDRLHQLVTNVRTR